MNTNDAGDVRPATKRTIDAEELCRLLTVHLRSSHQPENDEILRKIKAAFPIAEPTHAYESPRVVDAAVEMVKEVELHKAKREKDREDWLAQFPGWVREWCADDDKIVPLRCGDTWLLYADAGTVEWGRCDWFGLHYREASPGKQFVGRLIDLAVDLNLTLYADGNVPLWGDEVEYANEDDKGLPGGVVQSIASETINYANGGFDEIADLVLLRRHPAIADLPGIVVERDTNETRGTADEANKSTIVADKCSRFVKPTDSNSASMLRVGQRVRHTESGREGMLTRMGDELKGRSWVLFDDNGKEQRVFRSDLTPIPPPLIDNGDGKFTIEGYSAFWIARRPGGWIAPRPGGWRWEFIQNHSANGLWSHGECFPTKEAAAEDLWRRMEGVNR